MISINNELYLQPVLISDSRKLIVLMREIYTPAYSHFWKDGGNWYIDSQYSEAFLENEFLDPKARSYFIVYKGEIIGNFRFIWGEKLSGVSEEKQVKLHRLYLHPKTHGNGIGKIMLSWLTEKAVQNNYQMIWLDAMNEKTQAFEFYKKLGFQYFSHTFLDFKYMLDEVRKMSQLVKKLD
jgi:ribosomal protein S18 acetylase RimI-like enzyme